MNLKTDDDINSLWDVSYFIGNKETGIYCFPWCIYQRDTKDLICFETRQEAENTAYSPCKNCCSITPIGSWEEAEQDIFINLPVEFNMEANLNYMLRDKNECLFEINDGTITRALAFDEHRSIVQIMATENNQLRVNFLGDTRPKERYQRAEIVRYIREWFDLDTHLSTFYDLAKTDPFLMKPVQDFYGLRIIGIPDLFEALCWGILGQQINLRFAYILKKQFVEKFGDFIEWDCKKYWIFPSYKKIASLTPDDLSDIKMTMKKSEYIIGIAQLMASGELSKAKLMKLNHFNEIEKSLIKIRGIGPWTANYVLMRCLRFPSAFPIEDVGLINAIKSLAHMDRKPTKEEIRTIAIPWENWEAYATFYLWRVLY
ncbi:DNA-3-methyladenine glycosylase 2 [Bacillus sp. 03113]|uniref:DNA-3-methyladenine glycosylase 2 n=1 Tax=Bacillus sp. 03113 TaxID=2578211 RepID=UPI00215C7C53|nr:DNA-3-methyladenine glycosylase 2 [Bacillus sp. 03113]